VAGTDLDHEEHVPAAQSDGAVDVEELAGKQARGLGAARKLASRMTDAAGKPPGQRLIPFWEPLQASLRAFLADSRVDSAIW